MRQRSVIVIGTSAVLVTMSLAGVQASAAPSHARPLAKVSQAASHGGRVIITMRQQFPNLKIRQNHVRTDATRASQRSLTSQITAHGGTDIRHLVSVNAIAAKVSASEVQQLRRDPAVASVQRDAAVVEPHTTAIPDITASSQICPADPSHPLLEPEALTLTHFESQPAASTDADAIATGKGVRIGLTDINALAGNPNFIRPNGDHVVLDSPTPNADNDDTDGGGDEWYGDASSISGQGTVVYDFSHELPNSGLPVGCTFVIKGIAPDASLVDTGFFGAGPGNAAGSDVPQYESEAIAGLDHAAILDGVTVISESYGFGAVPGQIDFSAINIANDQLVQSGITVVESAGDSGTGGTVEVPAYDPLVIDAGATTAYRLDAQAWGYSGWENNQMAALSSGGTTPSNNLVDLVAPGDGGEASCSPASATCPATTLTEAFGGTSQSAPFIAGAAADVIQAYSDSHGGTQPTPALVKEILTGTATDIGAASDDQGAGLLNVYGAVRAAQQEPGSTVVSTSHQLVPSPTQIDVSGAGGSKSTQSVTLFNASSATATVHGTYRSFTAPSQIGSTVTEPVSAPASGPFPAEGALAASDVSMTVPDHLSQLGVDMITPNPTNDAVLSLLLFDPNGNLSQFSYDYSSSPTGPVSNNEHVSIDNPMAGTWTARVVWNNGRSHLQDPTPTPGSYRGNISIRFTGQTAVTSKATGAISIPAHSSAIVPLKIALPGQQGDYPESVQFVSNKGADTSIPIARRTVVPVKGGFSFTLGSSVARGFGPLQSREIDVPAGENDLRVTFSTPDTSPNNIIDYFLVEPNGLDGYYDRTASTTPQGVGSSTPNGHAAIVVANPPPGKWIVQAMIDATESGHEFTQTVTGKASYNSAKAKVLSGLPTATTTHLAAGSRRTVSVNLTNTTGIGRTFSLESLSDDIIGPGVYIPSGATALVTGTLTSTGPSGSAVTGTLYVVSNNSSLSPLLNSQGFFFDTQTLTSFPYAYSVT
jgi:Subtilase family/Peptidase inhibitor I9